MARRRYVAGKVLQRQDSAKSQNLTITERIPASFARLFKEKYKGDLFSTRGQYTEGNIYISRLKKPQGNLSSEEEEKTTETEVSGVKSKNKESVDDLRTLSAALLRLTANRAAHEHLVRDHVGTKLIALARKRDPKTVESVSFALKNLSSSPSLSRKLMDHGIVDACSILSRSWQAVSVRVNAARCLCYLSEANLESILVSEGALPTLSALSSHVVTQPVAVCALHNLAVVQAPYDGLDVICKALAASLGLEDVSPEARLMAAKGLCVLAVHPFFRANLASESVVTVLTMVLRNSAPSGDLLRVISAILALMTVPRSVRGRLISSERVFSALELVVYLAGDAGASKIIKRVALALLLVSDDIAETKSLFVQEGGLDLVFTIFHCAGVKEDLFIMWLLTATLHCLMEVVLGRQHMDKVVEVLITTIGLCLNPPSGVQDILPVCHRECLLATNRLLCSSGVLDSSTAQRLIGLLMQLCSTRPVEKEKPKEKSDELVARALYLITANESILTAVVENGRVVPFLFKCLHQKDNSRLYALKALHRIASFADHSKAILGKGAKILTGLVISLSAQLDGMAPPRLSRQASRRTVSAAEAKHDATVEDLKATLGLATATLVCLHNHHQSQLRNELFDSGVIPACLWVLQNISLSPAAQVTVIPEDDEDDEDIGLEAPVSAVVKEQEEEEEEEEEDAMPPVAAPRFGWDPTAWSVMLLQQLACSRGSLVKILNSQSGPVLVEAFVGLSLKAEHLFMREVCAVVLRNICCETESLIALSDRMRGEDGEHALIRRLSKASLRLMNTYLEVLQHHGSAILCNATALLVTDVGGCDSLPPELPKDMMKGLILTALVRSHHRMTKILCLKALFNMWQLPALRSDLVNEGILWTTHVLSREKTPDVSALCARGFAQLSCHEEARQKLVTESGSLVSLMTLLEAALEGGETPAEEEYSGDEDSYSEEGPEADVECPPDCIAMLCVRALVEVVRYVKDGANALEKACGFSPVVVLLKLALKWQKMMVPAVEVLRSLTELEAVRMLLKEDSECQQMLIACACSKAAKGHTLSILLSGLYLNVAKDQEFNQWLTNPQQLAALRKLAGSGSIPSMRLCTDTLFNLAIGRCNRIRMLNSGALSVLTILSELSHLPSISQLAAVLTLLFHPVPEVVEVEDRSNDPLALPPSSNETPLGMDDISLVPGDLIRDVVTLVKSLTRNPECRDATQDHLAVALYKLALLPIYREPLLMEGAVGCVQSIVIDAIGASVPSPTSRSPFFEGKEEEVGVEERPGTGEGEEEPPPTSFRGSLSSSRMSRMAVLNVKRRPAGTYSTTRPVLRVKVGKRGVGLTFLLSQSNPVQVLEDSLLRLAGFLQCLTEVKEEYLQREMLLLGVPGLLADVGKTELATRDTKVFVVEGLCRVASLGKACDVEVIRTSVVPSLVELSQSMSPKVMRHCALALCYVGEVFPEEMELLEGGVVGLMIESLSGAPPDLQEGEPVATELPLPMGIPFSFNHNAELLLAGREANGTVLGETRRASPIESAGHSVSLLEKVVSDYASLPAVNTNSVFRLDPINDLLFGEVVPTKIPTDSIAEGRPPAPPRVIIDTLNNRSVDASASPSEPDDEQPDSAVSTGSREPGSRRGSRASVGRKGSQDWRQTTPRGFLPTVDAINQYSVSPAGSPSSGTGGKPRPKSGVAGRRKQGGQQRPRTSCGGRRKAHVMLNPLLPDPAVWGRKGAVFHNPTEDVSAEEEEKKKKARRKPRKGKGRRKPVRDVDSDLAAIARGSLAARLRWKAAQPLEAPVSATGPKKKRPTSRQRRPAKRRTFSNTPYMLSASPTASDFSKSLVFEEGSLDQGSMLTRSLALRIPGDGVSDHPLWSSIGPERSVVQEIQMSLPSAQWGDPLVNFAE